MKVNELSPKERVLYTLSKKKVDRVPVNFCAVPGVVNNLLSELGFDTRDQLLEYFEVDMRRIGAYSWGTFESSESDLEGYRTNMWGVKIKEEKAEEGKSRIIGPFDDSTAVEDVHAHNWPDIKNLDFTEVYELCDQYYDKYVTYGSPWAPFFHDVGDMFGQENFLVFMHTKHEVVHAAIEHIVEFQLEATERFLEAANGKLDIAYFGNDFGTQRGLFISPEMWNMFIRKHLKGFYDLAHDFGCKVMQHSCGAIRDIIPALIEDGVDILDPVQVEADNMDLAGLLKEFSDKLIFHGGISTQGVLPFGTASEVKEEVGKAVSLAGQSGSYILSSSQELEHDVPLQNIVAMFDTELRYF